MPSSHVAPEELPAANHPQKDLGITTNFGGIKYRTKSVPEEAKLVVTHPYSNDPPASHLESIVKEEELGLSPEDSRPLSRAWDG